MLERDDVFVAGGGDIDVADAERAFNGVHFEAFHGGLKGVDGVDFGDNHAGAVSAERVGAAFADIAIATHNGDFTGDHDIGRALETVCEGFAAAVEVVEFGLGDRVVHIDGWNEEFAYLGELVEAMDAGCGFLGDTFPSFCHLGPIAGAFLGDAAQERLHYGNFMVFGGLVGPLIAFFEFGSFVDEEGDIAAVIDNELRAEVAREGDGLEGEFPIFFEGLAFPGKNGRAGLRDGCGGMVLSRKDVAAGPTNIGAEVNHRLDENRCLDRHVERSGHANAFEGLLLGIFFADSHEAGHLMLGNIDFLASPVGQRDVGNDVIRALRGRSGVFCEVGRRGSEFGKNGSGGVF